MSRISKNIGLKLKNLRVENDLTVRDVAEKINISHSMYYRIENGNTNSVFDVLDDIVKLYNLESEEVLLIDYKSLSSISNTNLLEVLRTLGEALNEKNKRIAELGSQIELLSERLGKLQPS